MPSDEDILPSEIWEVILNELGYHPSPDDPGGIIHLTEGKFRTPKAIFFYPEWGRYEIGIMVPHLCGHGLPEKAVRDAIQKVVG